MTLLHFIFLFFLSSLHVSMARVCACFVTRGRHRASSAYDLAIQLARMETMMAEMQRALSHALLVNSTALPQQRHAQPQPQARAAPAVPLVGSFCERDC